MYDYAPHRRRIQQKSEESFLGAVARIARSFAKASRKALKKAKKKKKKK